MSRCVVRKAELSDLTPISRLLRSESLPVEGVSDHLNNFFVAALNGNVVGAMGLEVYGDIALLRSAVVMPSYRDKGIGTLLYDRILDHAKLFGVQRLVLLTTTAEKYFRRKGFVTIDRARLEGPITASFEFTDACPTSAVCMELPL